MTDKAHIKEIFESIQGEGPYVGCKQLFVRFCGCNLNCKYCDTNFVGGDGSAFYDPESLAYIVGKHKKCRSVSLTGGEPLMYTSFLKDFLPISPLPIYLETNGTLSGSLAEVIDYIDYISADIKLPSCSGLPELWEEHDAFFEVAKQKELFAKIVFDKNITDEEITNCCTLGAKHRIELILQPKMVGDKLSVKSDFIEQIFAKFLKKYKKVRVIPQVHKFLNVQ